MDVKDKKVAIVTFRLESTVMNCLALDLQLHCAINICKSSKGL